MDTFILLLPLLDAFVIPFILSEFIYVFLLMIAFAISSIIVVRVIPSRFSQSSPHLAGLVCGLGVFVPSSISTYFFAFFLTSTDSMIVFIAFEAAMLVVSVLIAGTVVWHLKTLMPRS